MPTLPKPAERSSSRRADARRPHGPARGRARAFGGGGRRHRATPARVDDGAAAAPPGWRAQVENTPCPRVTHAVARTLGGNRVKKLRERKRGLSKPAVRPEWVVESAARRRRQDVGPYLLWAAAPTTRTFFRTDREAEQYRTLEAALAARRGIGEDYDAAAADDDAALARRLQAADAPPDDAADAALAARLQAREGTAASVAAALADAKRRVEPSPDDDADDGRAAPGPPLFARVERFETLGPAVPAERKPARRFSGVRRPRRRRPALGTSTRHPAAGPRPAPDDAAANVAPRGGAATRPR